MICSLIDSESVILQLLIWKFVELLQSQKEFFDVFNTKSVKENQKNLKNQWKP